jgi:hypothetical protein
MNTTIPDFTDAGQKLVSAALFGCHGMLVAFQLADCELQFDASGEELTLCPTIFWPGPVRNLWCAKPLPTAFAVNPPIPSRSILERA